MRIVGHSLGGMLARGLAVRRPDLVSGIVTMGSPMLAPGTAHPVLLDRRRHAGPAQPRRRAGPDVGGLRRRARAPRASFEESRTPLLPGIDLTCVYSRGDGIVDWRACIDPLARPFEVFASHLGMAIDPRVIDVVVGQLTDQQLHRGPRRVRLTALARAQCSKSMAV